MKPDAATMQVIELTKLEYLTAAALSGLPQAYTGSSARQVAQFAVRIAQETITELERVEADDAKRNA